MQSQSGSRFTGPRGDRHMTHITLNRRALLAGAAAGLTIAGQAWAKTEDLFPIAETSNGKLRGLVSGGVKVFKGVHYGADTSGANRFLPPKPVKNWAGV